MLKDKKIKILGLDYTIIEVPCISVDEYRLGEIDYLKQVIKLVVDMNEQKKATTLIHEILHAVLQQLGFEEQSDERLIQSLSTALYQIIRENEVLQLLLFPSLSLT